MPLSFVSHASISWEIAGKSVTSECRVDSIPRCLVGSRRRVRVYPASSSPQKSIKKGWDIFYFVGRRLFLKHMSIFCEDVVICEGGDGLEHKRTYVLSINRPRVNAYILTELFPELCRTRFGYPVKHYSIRIIFLKRCLVLKRLRIQKRKVTISEFGTLLSLLKLHWRSEIFRREMLMTGLFLFASRFLHFPNKIYDFGRQLTGGIHFGWSIGLYELEMSTEKH